VVSLEQVKLLESKVVKAIGYVDKINGENNLLRTKLESYQKRIDELEVLIRRFKEDQGRIEEGILSALNRLNQFEAAIEDSLSLGKPHEYPVPEEAAQPEEEEALPDIFQSRQDKGDETETTGQSLSELLSPQDGEKETEDNLILEPENDDLPEEDMNPDEPLNPGELDIF
jgi:hypothetical protein